MQRRLDQYHADQTKVVINDKSYDIKPDPDWTPTILIVGKQIGGYV